MSIVDGEGLVTWEGGLFEPNSDLLHRVQWAFGRIRADGGVIVLNEAGRPFGEPSDMNVRNAWQTASGISTVWFQWGRYKRGETPSAANPNSGALASEHTQGKAIDCDARNVYTATLRAKYFAQVGMQQTIASESWHWAIRGPALVSVAAAGNVTPITSNVERTDDDEMISNDGLKQLKDLVTTVVRDEVLKSTTVNLYRNKVSGSIAIADVSKGFWREFSSMPDMTTLKSLGVFDPEEVSQDVDPGTYSGVKAECIAAAKQFLRFAQTGK
jgi:hypothetical protein